MAYLLAATVPLPSNAAPPDICKLPQDAAAPLESQIDVLVAALDDCDEAHTLDDDAALKYKALLINLRADVAEVRRRHHGDLLQGDRDRFSTRLAHIVSMVARS